jgi:23S rRNA pseudouridine2604 synthase
MSDWTGRYDGAEPQRVNRWLAQSGVCSRREAEALIAEGAVLIDGDAVTDVGRKIQPGQTLTLRREGASWSVVVHKPLGYVSAQPDPGQVPAARLLTANRRSGPGPVADPGHSFAPLGRLDKDSRGLLLLSDDGVLARALIGPESRIEKEYKVRVEGDITPEKVRRLRHGLTLDGKALQPAGVFFISPGRLRFVLTEGRNRQIRRMCEQVELRVTDLFRVRIGNLRLGDLKEGSWRHLLPEERADFLSASRMETR